MLRRYQARTSSTLLRIACPSPMPLLSATTSTPMVKPIRIVRCSACREASRPIVSSEPRSNQAIPRVKGSNTAGIRRMNATSIIKPAGMAQPTCKSPRATPAKAAARDKPSERAQKAAPCADNALAHPAVRR